MIYQFGDCTWDTARDELRRSGEIVRVSLQALVLLRYLLAHRDRLVSRDELFENCWPDSYVSDSTLTSWMRRVRQVIGQTRTGPTLIETLHRRGYRFVAEVTELAEADPAMPEVEIVPPGTPRTAVAAPPAVEQDDAPAQVAESFVQTALQLSEPLATTERRHLTVLSGALPDAERFIQVLDPEDYHDLIQTLRALTLATITSYEGHVVRHLEHGLLVYFGYPQVHEDDAQRAVRSGLALVEALAQVVPPGLAGGQAGVAISIGIDSGMVLMSSGTGLTALQLLATGSPLMRAMELSRQARPRMVVISEASAQLVGDYFDCKVLADWGLAGQTESEVAYEVISENAMQTRIEIGMARGLTPFVGRETELAALRDRWAYVHEGMGQVVLLRGEAGIGKSRLLQVLKDEVADEPSQLIECRCSPYHQHTALYPLIALLNRILQARSAASRTNPMATLEAFLNAYPLPLDESVPLLASLLSLPVPTGRYPPLDWSPQRQRERTLEVLLTLVVAQASASRLLFIVEDLHWADPSTLEFLELLMGQVPTTAVLAILTFRPTFEVPWSDPTWVTQMTLNRLMRAQTYEMIRQVLGGKGFAAQVMEQLAEKMDGVPLFVEELTRTVLETDQFEERHGNYELVGELSHLSIPTTLYDSLMSRFDRLSGAQEIAQWGAVIGREFSYALIEQVTPYAEVELQSGLDHLVASELVFRRGLGRQAQYRFKHALVQDVAYQTLRRQMRQACHQRVAQVLAEQFPETVETQPELLAHHYTEAACLEQAIVYWQRAGQHAAQRSAMQEAMRHLSTGLELLATLPESPERAQQELNLHLALGPVLMATRGNGAAEVEQTYSRARELCQQVGETPQLFPALRGLWLVYQNGGRLAMAREVGEQLLSLAQRQHDATRRMAAHVSLGTTLTWMGAFTAARPHLEQGITLSDPEAQRTLALRYGVAPGVQCLNYTAIALWCLGAPDQGLERSQAACTLARKLGHPLSLAAALYYVARLHLLRGEAQATREQAEALIALSTEHILLQPLAYGRFTLGLALVAQGQGEEGVTLIRQGVTDVRATESRVALPEFLPVVAAVYVALGQVDSGLPMVPEALELVEQTGVHWYEAETYRIKGTLLLHQAVPDAAQAEGCFQQALDIACHQEAKSWQLRAATSLARLWQSQGKRQEAYDLLAPVYEWFTEGFDTADLIDAKKLLDVLA